MKITLDINDTLLARAKVLAARESTSLTRLIEEGLQLRLRTSVMLKRIRKCAIPVFHGKGGLAAGINPLSNKALLDAASENA